VKRDDRNCLFNLIGTNLYSFPRDSGAPMYWITGSNNVTMGILQGGLFPGVSRNGNWVGVNTRFTPAGRILIAFNLQRY